jgi:hypothetical protein
MSPLVEEALEFLFYFSLAISDHNYLDSGIGLLRLLLCFQQRRAGSPHQRLQYTTRHDRKIKCFHPGRQPILDYSAMSIKASYHLDATAHDTHCLSSKSAVFYWSASYSTVHSFHHLDDGRLYFLRRPFLGYPVKCHGVSTPSSKMACYHRPGHCDGTCTTHFASPIGLGITNVH